MVVISVAVQNADVPVVVLNPVGVQVAGAPTLELPLRNCTVPVGPCEELLLDETVAVSVTLPPLATIVVLGTNAAVVVACVIVTDSELLTACEL